MYTKLRPGGYFFISAVPMLNIPHMTPFHFHHFTPMGLAMNAVQAAFEIVEMGQWGNQDYGTNLLGLLAVARLQVARRGRQKAWRGGCRR